MNRQKQIIIYQLSIIIVPSAPFTVVENSLQISSFMQNKPNFLDALMNVTSLITADYENMPLCIRRKNKPNTNPIKANKNPIKANIMPKQTQFKPNQTQFPTDLGGQVYDY